MQSGQAGVPPVTPVPLMGVQQEACSLGDPILDACFGGGLPSAVIEICGEASAGKTQIAVQTMLNAALPYAEAAARRSSTPAMSAKGKPTNAARAVYLNTEGRFPMSRARQLEMALLSTANKALPAGAPPLQANCLLDQCLISDIADAAALMKAVTIQLPASLRQHSVFAPTHGASSTAPPTVEALAPIAPSQQGSQPAPRSSIRLVVIDSIASVLRAEFDTSGRSSSFARAQYMYDLSSALKRLANTYGLAVLVVNQVTAASVELGNVGQSAPIADQMRACGCAGGATSAAASAAVPLNVWGGGGGVEQGSTKAALGAVWSHCVTARVMLTRTPPAGSLPPLSVPVTLPPAAMAAALQTCQVQAQQASAETPSSEDSPSAGVAVHGGGSLKRSRDGDEIAGAIGAASARQGPPVLSTASPTWPSNSVSLAAGMGLDPEALFDCSTVEKGALRWAHVQFSPWCPNNGGLYTVTADGVVGVVLVQQ